jgi:hypothetical protein
MMKYRYWWILGAVMIIALLAFACPISAQVPEYRFNDPLRLEWTYSAMDLACETCEGPVVRFEVRIDENPLHDTGLPLIAPDTYQYQLPAEELRRGDHLIFVRACNAVECSEEASIAVRIRGGSPGPPLNLQLLEGGEYELDAATRSQGHRQ